MSAATIVVNTRARKIEKSIQPKVWEFLHKVQEDDSRPGLDIKQPQGAADKNVRTARVDNFYRAVMFLLASSQQDSRHYVLVGVYPHDEAYKVASRISLEVNPINGVTELIETAAPAVTAAPTVHAEPAEAEESGDQETEDSGAGEPGPASGTDSTAAGGLPLLPEVGERHVGRTLGRIGRETLTDQLGLSAQLVDRALQLGTVDELLALLVTTHVPEWQSDAIMDLASGSQVRDVELKLDLRDETPAEAAAYGGSDSAGDHRILAESNETDASHAIDSSAVAEEQDANERILAGLRTEAARLSFAFVEGEDELRAAIEGGDFAAWRVFLHPEQRRWAQRDYNGAFRLSGGAGTGKTVVLVHRAVRFQREALAAGRPSPRIILTTYTKNLADELRSQVTLLEPKAVIADEWGEPGIHVTGLDALAARVIRDADSSELRAATEAVLGRGRTNVHQRTSSNAWSEAILTAGVTLPDRGDGAAFVRSEYELVVLAGQLTEKAQYLRVRRPNRGVRLSRRQRADVWEVIEAYRSAANIDDTIDFQETLHIAAQVLRQRAHATDIPGAADDERRRAYPADHVLVDEGQDLTVGHLAVLRALVKPGPNDIFLAEDSHQRIYGEKIILSHHGIRIQGRSRRLTLNYRTTEQILTFALQILTGEEIAGSDAGSGYSDMQGEAESRTGYRSLRSGAVPHCVGFDSRSSELEAVGAIMRRWLDACEADVQLRPEQLAILTRSSRARDAVVRALADVGVDVRAIGSGRVAPGKPVVLTMHRAKGTEFRNVVLAGVSEDGVPAALASERYSPEASADIDQRERSLLYVAATRARDELVVTWTGRPSPFLPVRQT